MQIIEGKKESLGSKLFGFMKPLVFSFRYIHTKSWVFVSLMSAAIVMTVTRLLVPIYIGDSVTAIQNGSLASTLTFAMFIVYVSVFAAITRFAVNYSGQYLAQYYAYGLTGDLFTHVLKKRFAFYENQTSGDLLSRSTLDIRASQNFILATMSQLIPTMLLIVTALYFLFTLNAFYALAFLVSVPILIYTGIIFQRKQRVHWKNIRLNYGRMNEELQENIVGQRVIRGFSAEDQEIRKFTGTTYEYYDQYMKIAKLRGFYINIMPFIVTAAATAILLFGGYTLLVSHADVGKLVSAISIFTTMSFPVSFLGRLIVFSENARASIERISGILEGGQEEIFDKGDEHTNSSDLVYTNVSFSRGKRTILKNIDISVRQGEILGISGKTAAGKSSLVNLIPRFYDPDSGTIKIGGVDTRSVPLVELRRMVSLVPQEINILSGTISENIAFGNSETDIERIRWAAGLAQIADFIEELPSGYDTVVGERGITLSGGQKQRVGVARALYEKPKILILDDATASVDPKTELEMLKAIKKAMSQTSVILVTHRKSALKFCDRVIRLEKGIITENSSDDMDLGAEPDIQYDSSGGVGNAQDI